MKSINVVFLMLAVIVLSSQLSFARENEFANYQLKSLKFNDIHRTYSVYVPKSYNGKSQMPLLVALHGGGGTAKEWPRYTQYGFEKLSERDQFIICYPEGIEKNWNDGRNVEHIYAQKNNIDDAGFLAKLIDELVKDYPIDRKRIYMTGASNGGMMTQVFAGMYSEKLAAIAAVISAIPKNMDGKLYPKKPISVLIMNGTLDPLVQWNGGVVKLGRTTHGEVISTEKTVRFWVDHNKCSHTPKEIVLPDLDPEDETRVKESIYGGGNNGTEVILYSVIGGGHEWPSYKDSRRKILKQVVDKVVGLKSRDIDACEIIWEFFKIHSNQ